MSDSNNLPEIPTGSLNDLSISYERKLKSLSELTLGDTQTQEASQKAPDNNQKTADQGKDNVKPRSFGNSELVEIKKGDSIWNAAQAKYGPNIPLAAIYEANRLTPRKIEIVNGKRLITPPVYEPGQYILPDERLVEQLTKAFWARMNSNAPSGDAAAKENTTNAPSTTEKTSDAEVKAGSATDSSTKQEKVEPTKAPVEATTTVSPQVATRTGDQTLPQVKPVDGSTQVKPEQKSAEAQCTPQPKSADSEIKEAMLNRYQQLQKEFDDAKAKFEKEHKQEGLLGMASDFIHNALGKHKEDENPFASLWSHVVNKKDGSEEIKKTMQEQESLLKQMKEAVGNNNLEKFREIHKNKLLTGGRDREGKEFDPLSANNVHIKAKEDAKNFSGSQENTTHGLADFGTGIVAVVGAFALRDKLVALAPTLAKVPMFATLAPALAKAPQLALTIPIGAGIGAGTRPLLTHFADATFSPDGSFRLGQYADLTKDVTAGTIVGALSPIAVGIHGKTAEALGSKYMTAEQAAQMGPVKKFILGRTISASGAAAGNSFFSGADTFIRGTIDGRVVDPGEIATAAATGGLFGFGLGLLGPGYKPGEVAKAKGDTPENPQPNTLQDFFGKGAEIAKEIDELKKKGIDVDGDSEWQKLATGDETRTEDLQRFFKIKQLQHAEKLFAENAEKLGINLNEWLESPAVKQLRDAGMISAVPAEGGLKPAIEIDTKGDKALLNKILKEAIAAQNNIWKLQAPGKEAFWVTSSAKGDVEIVRLQGELDLIKNVLDKVVEKHIPPPAPADHSESTPENDTPSGNDASSSPPADVPVVVQPMDQLLSDVSAVCQQGKHGKLNGLAFDQDGNQMYQITGRPDAIKILREALKERRPDGWEIDQSACSNNKLIFKKVSAAESTELVATPDAQNLTAPSDTEPVEPSLQKLEFQSNVVLQPYTSIEQYATDNLSNVDGLSAQSLRANRFTVLDEALKKANLDAQQWLESPGLKSLAEGKHAVITTNDIGSAPRVIIKSYGDKALGEEIAKTLNIANQTTPGFLMRKLANHDIVLDGDLTKMQAALDLVAGKHRAALDTAKANYKPGDASTNVGDGGGKTTPGGVPIEAAPMHESNFITCKWEKGQGDKGATVFLQFNRGTDAHAVADQIKASINNSNIELKLTHDSKALKLKSLTDSDDELKAVFDSLLANTGAHPQLRFRPSDINGLPIGHSGDVNKVKARITDVKDAETTAEALREEAKTRQLNVTVETFEIPGKNKQKTGTNNTVALVGSVEDIQSFTNHLKSQNANPALEKIHHKLNDTQAARQKATTDGTSSSDRTPGGIEIDAPPPPKFDFKNFITCSLREATAKEPAALVINLSEKANGKILADQVAKIINDSNVALGLSSDFKTLTVKGTPEDLVRIQDRLLANSDLSNALKFRPREINGRSVYPTDSADQVKINVYEGKDAEAIAEHLKQAASDKNLSLNIAASKTKAGKDIIQLVGSVEEIESFTNHLKSQDASLNAELNKVREQLNKTRTKGPIESDNDDSTLPVGVEYNNPIEFTIGVDRLKPLFDKDGKQVDAGGVTIIIGGTAKQQLDMEPIIHAAANKYKLEFVKDDCDFKAKQIEAKDKIIADAEKSALAQGLSQDEVEAAGQAALKAVEEAEAKGKFDRLSIRVKADVVRSSDWDQLIKNIEHAESQLRGFEAELLNKNGISDGGVHQFTPYQCLGRIPSRGLNEGEIAIRATWPKDDASVKILDELLSKHNCQSYPTSSNDIKLINGQVRDLQTLDAAIAHEAPDLYVRLLQGTDIQGNRAQAAAKVIEKYGGTYHKAVETINQIIKRDGLNTKEGEQANYALSTIEALRNRAPLFSGEFEPMTQLNDALQIPANDATFEIQFANQSDANRAARELIASGFTGLQSKLAKEPVLIIEAENAPAALEILNRDPLAKQSIRQGLQDVQERIQLIEQVQAQLKAIGPEELEKSLGRFTSTTDASGAETFSLEIATDTPEGNQLLTDVLASCQNSKKAIELGNAHHADFETAVNGNNTIVTVGGNKEARQFVAHELLKNPAVEKALEKPSTPAVQGGPLDSTDFVSDASLFDEQAFSLPSTDPDMTTKIVKAFRNARLQDYADFVVEPDRIELTGKRNGQNSAALDALNAEADLVEYIRQQMQAAQNGASNPGNP